MIKFIKAWLARRREFRRQVEFIRGRLWAVGELRSGRMTPEQISDRIYDPIDGVSPFDRGAMDALYYWELELVDPEAARKEAP